jgi:hypothetical protein
LPCWSRGPSGGGLVPGSPPPEEPQDLGKLYADVTNLLPGNTEAVTALAVSRLLEGPIGGVLTQQPMGFDTELFADVWGLSQTEISRTIQAANATN